MTLPSPGVPSFVAGFAPQVADMTTLVTNPLSFCSSPVLVRVEQTIAQAIGASAFTTIQFDSVLEDPYSAWNAGTFLFTAPFTGYYEVQLTVGLDTAGASVATCILISGVTQYTITEASAPSTNPSGTPSSFIVPMVGGFDTLAGQVFTNIAVSTSSNVGLRSCMEIRFVTV